MPSQTSTNTKLRKQQFQNCIFKTALAKKSNISKTEFSKQFMNSMFKRKKEACSKQLFRNHKALRPKQKGGIVNLPAACPDTQSQSSYSSPELARAASTRVKVVRRDVMVPSSFLAFFSSLATAAAS